MTNLVQLVAAFTGSLGFAALFRVRREKILLAGIGGLLSWAVYLALGPVMPQDVPRFFISAVAVGLYAEILARVVKFPATLFLVTGTIPLISGGGLYRTMSAFMAGDYAACSAQGLNTLLLAVALAVGMLFPMSIFQLIRRVQVHLAQKQRSGRGQR